MSGMEMIKPKTIKWAGHAAHMLEKRNAHRIVVGKPEEMRSAIRPTRFWENNVKLALK
jgi:RNase H-fold protein (predicted Holliday junction resolvase)